MSQKLSEKAKEGSTFAIRVDFTVKANPDDDAGTPFTPNSGLIWSLKDQNGDPVNGKTDMPIGSAESITIVLSGADLALVGGAVRRFVTIEGTFNGVLGDNLPLVDEVSFQIENLVGMP
ncbi:hypothetical protein KAR91_23050 [Candidatus Pacearchaeota archaeon]|nr:hypothetical protein [Candidatus Pacearchaeota archaeon]